MSNTYEIISILNDVEFVEAENRMHADDVEQETK